LDFNYSEDLELILEVFSKEMGRRRDRIGGDPVQKMDLPWPKGWGAERENGFNRD